MRQLEKLLNEGPGYNSSLDDLQKVYDATESLLIYRVLNYPIDYAKALKQAEAIGASRQTIDFLKLGLEIKDKYHQMDKLLIAARHNLGTFKELR